MKITIHDAENGAMLNISYEAGDPTETTVYKFEKEDPKELCWLLFDIAEALIGAGNKHDSQRVTVQIEH